MPDRALLRLLFVAGAVGLAAPAEAGDLIAGPARVVTATEDYDPRFFSELRLGALASVDGRERVREDGVFVDAQILLNPILPPLDNLVAELLLRPRPHAGVTVSTAGETNQVYAGLTWTFPVTSVLFLEASFGATLHDRPLDEDFEDGAKLGCHLLFRESVGIGLALGPRWNVIATVDHASHAGLCGANDGLTHAGTSLGYRF